MPGEYFYISETTTDCLPCHYSWLTILIINFFLVILQIVINVMMRIMLLLVLNHAVGEEHLMEDIVNAIWEHMMMDRIISAKTAIILGK